MPLQDLFVGALAAMIGVVLIAGALRDSVWLMSLAKSRLLAERLGKMATRWTLAAVGLVLIVMGGLIASGWRIHWR
jgi:hypothetical protein